MRVRTVNVLYIPASPIHNARKAQIQPILSVLQAWVGGDIEEIFTPSGLMVVNTDGLRHRLPINPLASELAGLPIFGDVLVTGGADEEGNLLPYKKAIPRPTGRPVGSI